MAAQRLAAWVSAALILALVFSASYAAAQEPTAIEMSVPDAAKVLGAAERVPGLESEVGALRAENEALKQQITRYEKLTELDAAIIGKEQALRGLAEQERDAYRERAERIAKDAGKAGFWSRVKERAAEGALLGTIGGTAIPGVGNVLGGIGGAVIGGVVGAVESALGP